MIADTTLGWTLVHFLWQGTALAALVAIVMVATRSPRVRYAAGCAALALMAIAPVLTYLVLRETGAAPELGPLLFALGSGNGLSRAATAEPTNWVSFIPAFWLAGVTVLSARLMLAVWGVHRLTHRDATPITNEWRHLSERLGLTRGVTFLTSSRIAGPVQAGFLKPVILLPASLLMQLPAAQVEAIIAHELTHIRRHDYLVNLLQSVVETLLFYHPAVWWVSRVVRAEREVCCDVMAAAVTGGKRDYAEALVALEQLASADVALTMAASGGDLRVRITRLLGHSEGSARVGVPALLVALLLAGAMTFPLFESRAQNPQPAPAATATPVPTQQQVPLTNDVGALQQEIGRLQRELATLKADTAARILQNADADRLTKLEAERLARTEAQMSLERLSNAQAEVIRAKTLVDEAAKTYTNEHPELRERTEQLARALAALAQSSAYNRWLREDVAYIISAPESMRFLMLTTDGEREEFVKQFWQRRDPNPATEVNEMKEEHYRRLAYANAKWSTPTKAGWATERGRMYVVKGPPDEIESHPAEGREKWLYRWPQAIYEFKTETYVGEPFPPPHRVQ